MRPRSVPKWAPPAGFAVVVVLVAVFVIVTASRSDDRNEEGFSSSNAPEQRSPEGVAFRALAYVQAGSVPAAIQLYDPRVVREFGSEDMFETLSLRRPSLAGQRFTVGLRETTPQGRLVVVDSRGAQGSTQYSFTLAKRGGGWKIAYDSFFGDALSEFVQLRAQRRLAPGRKQPSPSAQRAGRRASARYRELLATR